MEADKLLEELGYKLIGDCKDNLVYKREGNSPEKNGIYESWACIIFDLSTKTVSASADYEPKDITLAELKAINTKITELCW